MHVLKAKKVRELFEFTQKWDGLCYLCGHPFANMACVTKDHIQPQSLYVHSVDIRKRVAPAHYSCNQFRKVESLLKATKKLQIKETKMGVNFIQWINKKNPSFKEVHWTGLLSPAELSKILGEKSGS